VSGLLPAQAACPGLPPGDARVGAAELSGDVLSEDVAVTLGVCRAEEGRHDLELEFIEPRKLGPERREANVDVELEELDG
jgi:hypothetical protein